MKTYIDIDKWERKELFNHFNSFLDPSFGLVANVDVTIAYQYAKDTKTSFFLRYFHDCVKVINSIENFRYRIEDDGKVALYDVIHAGTTIPVEGNLFRFSQTEFSWDFKEFSSNFELEKQRVLQSESLYPAERAIKNCVYTSALPWVSFTGHKDPVMQINDGIPRLSFGKVELVDGKRLMSVALNAHHALVDGYHAGEFFEKFQKELNKID